MKLLGSIFICSGATAYECQVGRIWFGIYRPRFIRTSGIGFVRIAPQDDDTPEAPQ